MKTKKVGAVIVALLLVGELTNNNIPTTAISFTY